MRKLFLIVMILLIAAPAFAGTWDADKLWTASMNPTTLSGFGWVLEGAGSETWGTYNPPYPQEPYTIKDRTGTMDALVLDNESDKNKYRSDGTGWAYDTSKATCFLMGAYMLDSTSSYPQIYIRTAAGSVKIRYDDAGQQWIPADSNMQFGAGSPTSLAVPLSTWHYIRFQLNPDKSWDAWLNEDPNQHMWGTYIGTSTGSYVQFGALGTTSDSSEFAVDLVAWGQGDAIGDMVVIPEPGSILALSLGLLGTVGFIRKRR